MKGRRRAVTALSLTAMLAATSAVAASADTTSAAAATTAGAPIAGRLLAAPDQDFVRAVDVNELGVVVGNAAPSDPAYTNGVTAQRWLPVGNRFVRQQLQTPSGSTGARVTGVNRFGEPAGTTGTGADYTSFRAVRWPITGLKPVYLGGANSEVTAVGDTTWGVAKPSPNFISGTGEIVARDGTSTPVNDFPELPGRIHTVTQIGSKDTALVGTVDGVGGGTNGQPGVVQGGRAKALPVRFLVFYGRYCTSAMRPDGTVAYSGYSVSSTGLTISIAIHRGGVPGTEQNLPTGDRFGSLGCDTSDTLASDDTTAGYLWSTGTRPEEAAVWRGGVLTDLGVPAGFSTARAVAVATRGRAVVLARGSQSDDPKGAFLIKDDVSSPLAVPSGWSLVDIVEMTDRGLVVGNVRNAAGKMRPIVWRT